MRSLKASYVGRILLWEKTFLRRKRLFFFYLKNGRLRQIYLKDFPCWRSSVPWFLLTCRSQMFAKFIGRQRSEQKEKWSTSQVSRRWKEWMKQKVKWKGKEKIKEQRKDLQRIETKIMWRKYKKNSYKKEVIKKARQENRKLKLQNR